MHIGLFTGAIASGAQTGAGGSSQEPQGLTPIPGILDAPNVVILGASIMDSGFGTGQTLNTPIAAYAAAAGFTGTLLVRSQSGDPIGGTIAKHTAASAEPAISATAGQNLYVVHTGGNNVSASRPWPGGQSSFQSGYDTLMAQITAASDKVVPLPLTKRLYPDAPAVIHGDTASEANGSKPFNENIIYPAIQSNAPDWRNAPGTPFVNPYELADRYPQIVGSDGVHGYGASIARYILARLAGRAMGKSIGESRTGRSILYSITSGEPNTMRIGQMNVFRSYSSGFLNNPLLCGAVTYDGAFDPFIELAPTGTFQNASANAGTGTYARIADTRFHVPDLVNNGIYVQGTQVFTLDFANLTPGDTVTLTAVGVRGASGTNRRGLLTLSTGQSLELNAANDAPSNMITFTPVQIPANGRLSLSLSVAPGSTYGYLHGVMLDFS